MKNFLLLITVFLIISSCVNSQEKEKVNFVFDYENILQNNEKERFDSLFNSHEMKTTNEIVLVTTPDYGEQPDIVMYSQVFGEQNGIGKANKDNGIVIVFSNAQRGVRVATGYGVEDILKDEIAKRMIDNIMIPKAKEGKTTEGLWLMCLEIVEFLEKPENKIVSKEYRQKK